LYFAISVSDIIIPPIKEIAAKLAVAARKDEGCISYQIFQTMADEKIFAFIEEWKSQEALDIHVHSAELGPMLDGALEKEPEANFYTLVL
jgi:quinol monooxygenase YgiN